MSVSMCVKEVETVRERALDMFKSDRAMRDDFFSEILSGCVSDELLKETGFWDEAVEQMNEQLHE